MIGDDDDANGGDDNGGDVSHPSDPNPGGGSTEYEPLGEPGEGEIYVPSSDPTPADPVEH